MIPQAKACMLWKTFVVYVADRPSKGRDFKLKTFCGFGHQSVNMGYESHPSVGQTKSFHKPQFAYLWFLENVSYS